GIGCLATGTSKLILHGYLEGTWIRQMRHFMHIKGRSRPRKSSTRPIWNNDPRLAIGIGVARHNGRNGPSLDWEPAIVVARAFDICRQPKGTLLTEDVRS